MIGRREGRIQGFEAREGIASRMSDGSLLEGLTTLGVESERKRVGACHLISFSRCDAG
jgi:hypothetical protein